VFSIGSDVEENVMANIASMPNEQHIVSGVSIDTGNTKALELIENLQIAKVEDGKCN
jgi:hypothetical protein